MRRALSGPAWVRRTTRLSVDSTGDPRQPSCKIRRAWNLAARTARAGPAPPLLSAHRQGACAVSSGVFHRRLGQPLARRALGGFPRDPQAVRRGLQAGVSVQPLRRTAPLARHPADVLDEDAAKACVDPGHAQQRPALGYRRAGVARKGASRYADIAGARSVAAMANAVLASTPPG